MKQRPILFSGPMVRAILEGKKTQTRRVVRPQPVLKPCADEKVGHAWHWKKGRREAIWWEKIATPMSMLQHCPYGGPGDRLWVREAWQTSRQYDDTKPSEIPEDSSLWYAADWTSIRRLGQKPGKTRPSIFMPRWASRLMLEVVEVRVERLQGITLQDCLAEGFDPIQVTAPGIALIPAPQVADDTARLMFRSVWDKLNAKRGYGYDVNPWVWVVTLKRISP